MKAWKIILLALAAAAVAWLAVSARHHSVIQRTDSAAAARVHAALAQALAKDAELTQRLGDFVRLEGEGYKRLHYTWQLIERMEMSRTAVFARGSVKLAVTVFCSEAEDLDQRPLGLISWKAMPGTEGRETLEVSVSIDQTARRPGPQPPPQEAAPATPRVWPLSAVALSADTGTVFIGRRDRIEIWERGAQTPRRQIEGRFGEVRSFAHAAQAGLLAVECEDEVKVIETATGKFTASFPIYRAERETPRIALSADGQTLIHAHYRQMFPVGGGSAMNTEMAAVQNLRDRSFTTLNAGGAAPARATALLLSPDGRHVLLTPDSSSRVLCWDLDTRTLIWDREGPMVDSPTEFAATFTPRTGRFCVCRASWKNASLQLWNTATGELEQTLEQPSDKLWRQSRQNVAMLQSKLRLAVSPEESLLALSADNGHALVWHLPSGRLLGMIFHRDWSLEGSLADTSGRPWKEPAPPRGGYQGIIIGQPYRGEKLAALGFTAANELIGVSLFPDVAWVWKSDLQKLLPGMPQR